MTDSTHFDFVSNCTTASALYNTLFDQLYDPLPMLLALQKGGVNTVVEDLNIQLGNATFVQDCARQIGTVCRPVVCSSLRFTGNADIAGIGAVIAYGLIVLLTILFITIQRLFRVDVMPFTAFFENIIYLQISAQIAFWAYLPRMGTCYELLLGQLVVRMMASAAHLMYFARKPLKPARVTRFFFWAGVYGSIATVGFGVTAQQYSRSHSYIDVPCDEAYKIPFLIVKISAGIYLVSIFYHGSAKNIEEDNGIIRFTVKMNDRTIRATIRIPDGFPANSTSTDIWSLLSLKQNTMSAYTEHTKLFFSWLPILWMITESLLLVATLALIITVRQRAANLFGPYYGDNAVGYGQILAAGFCLQTIIEILLVLKRHVWPKNQDASADQTPSAQKLDTASDHTATPTVPSRSRTSNMED